jgi:hypothetical protein
LVFSSSCLQFNTARRAKCEADSLFLKGGLIIYETGANVYLRNTDNNSMMNNLKLATSISDDLLQRLRDFLAAESDMIAVGNDPAQPSELNTAGRLLTALDSETGEEFAR